MKSKSPGGGSQAEPAVLQRVARSTSPVLLTSARNPVIGRRRGPRFAVLAFRIPQESSGITPAGWI